ncbi:hypothetical protein T01_4534 [Trichinella spiralis]|uniref:Transmembrane protein n=1 Tax=Trichinella spiralis TaxID=6334 RepID=A0A0V1BYP9_TRISP|nr:hypothetical protein T01_4534 [Trichinella spiralis]
MKDSSPHYICNLDLEAILLQFTQKIFLNFLFKCVYVKMQQNITFPITSNSVILLILTCVQFTIIATTLQNDSQTF